MTKAMIAENIQRIKSIISRTAAKVGRNPDDIKLVAVSKRFPPRSIIDACTSGHYLFGENYIQEVISKKEAIPSQASIHFIGHLQTNKAKIAAEYCDMIETVDRFKLGKALNKHLDKQAKKLDILVQVNIGEDPVKSGVDRDNTEGLLEQLSTLSRLRICGLMTMVPLVNEPEQSRIHFRRLRQLCVEMQRKGLFPEVSTPELSMGMSNDFQIAVEEGATIVRIGTAIFGKRLS